MAIPFIAIISIFHAGLWFCFSILSLIVFKNMKNSAYYIFSLMNALMGFAFGFIAHGISMNNNHSILASAVFISTSILTGLIFLGLIQENKINVWRTALGSMGLVACFILISKPNSIQIYEYMNESFLLWGGDLFILIICLGIIAMVFTLEFFIKTWLKAKKKISKGISNNILVGIVFIGFFVLVTLIYGNFYWIAIFVWFGFLYLGIIGFSHPKLLYLLAYDLNRIIIIEEKTGQLIYEYSWEEADNQQILFAGLLKGLSDMSNEVLQKGNINEIQLDNGIMLLNRTKQFYTGLLASQSSDYLQDCLIHFNHDLQVLYDSNKTEISLEKQENKKIDVLLSRYFLTKI